MGASSIPPPGGEPVNKGEVPKNQPQVSKMGPRKITLKNLGSGLKSVTSKIGNLVEGIVKPKPKEPSPPSTESPRKKAKFTPKEPASESPRQVKERTAASRDKNIIIGNRKAPPPAHAPPALPKKEDKLPPVPKRAAPERPQQKQKVEEEKNQAEEVRPPPPPKRAPPGLPPKKDVS